jgi:hypothetical protein
MLKIFHKLNFYYIKKYIQNRNSCNKQKEKRCWFERTSLKVMVIRPILTGIFFNPLLGNIDLDIDFVAN